MSNQSPPANIGGLSHYSLVAPSLALHNRARTFYLAIGFQIVAYKTQKSSTGPESWLHLFPAAKNLEAGSDGISLRIVVDPVSNFNEIDYVGHVGKKLNRLTDDKIVIEKQWLCFSGVDVEVLKTTLDEMKHSYDLNEMLSTSGPTTTASTADLRTFDPLGNLIEFTENISAFTTLTSTPNVTTSSLHRPSMTPIKESTMSPSILSPTIQKRKKKIGIMTSGGDSSGMNAAVRSITRMSWLRGCIPYAIFEGYQGLVDGGEFIKQLEWDDVRGLLAIGGTSIGTARCAAFRERAGRLTAAMNLVKNGIDALIVIGGDGSLTGADKFRGEWKGLIDELVATGMLKMEECAELRDNLTIVGLVGSIDNDMSSTDITIGAVTSLHRICESLDSLTSTALSHQRAFIVEVMGRHCGWLGLMAAIAVGGDWVFLPERPPPLDQVTYGDDWEKEMCEFIGRQRAMGNRKTLIIVCEGAIDRNLKPITPDNVKVALEKGLGLDSRITTLGHVQRGGTPCAYDRYLATVQGVEAVEAVLRSTPEIPSPMIGISQNKITAAPLLDAVRLTQSVAEAISKKDFKKAMELRDPDFTAAYDAYIESTLLALEPGAKKVPPKEQFRLGILHVGAPAGGMNAATRVAARLCLSRGLTPVGIRNGFAGLVKDDLRELEWQDLLGWQVSGGSELGANRDHPRPLPDSPIIFSAGEDYIDLGLIAFHLQKNNIQALLVIGGFEAYTSVLTLSSARKQYPAFCIPMINLPATISNNVPGTDYSIGSDTALNSIVESCDRLKLSANSSKGRAFIVEVQGGNCGYLAVMGGLASGATSTYIPEEGITLAALQSDINHLKRRYTEETHYGKISEVKKSEGRLILRSELASASTYSTETIAAIMRSESQDKFDCRTTVLGHLQQGGTPSPLDRIRATRLAVDCIDWLQSAVIEARDKDPSTTYPSIYTTKKEHACVIGIQGAQVLFSPVEDLLSLTDLKKRTGKEVWWMSLNTLVKDLAKQSFTEVDNTEIDIKKKSLNKKKSVMIKG